MEAAELDWLENIVHASAKGFCKGPENVILGSDRDDRDRVCL